MGNTLRNILKVLGILFGILIGLGIVSMAYLYYTTDLQINREYEVTPEIISIPSNPESIARGKHLVENIAFCSECHGENLAGQVFDNGPLLGRLRVANLTPGRDGIPQDFNDEDWILAIRHGIGPSGRSLIGMWSNYYYAFSDADLGDIIAYLKTLPPVDNEMQPTRLGPMARVLVLQDPTILPARVIDHESPHPQAPDPGPTVEYGKYLATFCTMCHGVDLSGGPNAVNGSNITPGGELGEWNYDEFVSTIRTGVNPAGRKLDPTLMPWKKIAQLSDLELKAIYLYLQTVPPVITQPTPMKGPR